MSDIDLTQAVEAGARARWDTLGMAVTWEQALVESPITAANFREDVLPVLTAATPLIEKAVREQVAQEIEDMRMPFTTHFDFPDVAWEYGQKAAARIARGGAR